jgi:hypothetical protein
MEKTVKIQSINPHEMLQTIGIFAFIITNLFVIRGLLLYYWPDLDTTRLHLALFVPGGGLAGAVGVLFLNRVRKNKRLKTDSNTRPDAKDSEVGLSRLMKVSLGAFAIGFMAFLVAGILGVITVVCFPQMQEGISQIFVQVVPAIIAAIAGIGYVFACLRKPAV